MNKDYTISFMRVFAMILIVLFHSYCYNYSIWPFFSTSRLESAHDILLLSNLGISIFVFIAGYLYGIGYYETDKYIDKYNILQNKFKRLIIPYIVWGSITVMIFPKAYPIYLLLQGVSHLWFLLMLFFLFIIVIAGRFLFDRLKLWHWIVFLTLFIVFIPKIYSFLGYGHGFFAIKDVFYYLPLFLLGMIIPKLRIEEKVSHIFVFEILLGSGILFSHYSSNNYLIALNRFLIYGFVINSLFFFHLLERKYKVMQVVAQSKVVRSLDSNSMAIYILHHTFIWIALYYEPSVRIFMDNHIISGPIFLFLVVFVTSWGVASLFSLNRKLKTILFG